MAMNADTPLLERVSKILARSIGSDDALRAGLLAELARDLASDALLTVDDASRCTGLSVSALA